MLETASRENILAEYSLNDTFRFHFLHILQPIPIHRCMHYNSRSIIIDLINLIIIVQILISHFKGICQYIWINVFSRDQTKEKVQTVPLLETRTDNIVSKSV